MEKKVINGEEIEKVDEYVYLGTLGALIDTERREMWVEESQTRGKPIINIVI